MTCTPPAPHPQGPTPTKRKKKKEKRKIKEKKKERKKKGSVNIVYKKVILTSPHHKVMSKERKDGDRWNIRYSVKTSIHDKYPSPESEIRTLSTPPAPRRAMKVSKLMADIERESPAPTGKRRAASRNIMRSQCCGI